MKSNMVILHGARTPMAEYVGTPGFGKLKDFTACQLGALAAREAIKRSGVEPGWISQVFMGNANQTANDALYGARDVMLRVEGIPLSTPALTVNRLCGSGVQSIVSGCHAIMAGEAEFVLAGGMESMSQSPYVVRGVRGTASRFGQNMVLEDSLFASLRHGLIDMAMAQTAEKLARQYGISRKDCDQYAYECQQKAKVALEKKLFDDEKVAVDIVDRKGKVTRIWDDDHAKPETTLEALAELKPAFGPEGMVTGGNASGIVDGAAAVVLTTEEWAAKKGLKPLARIVSWGIAGVDPTIMGLGPAPSTRQALERAGLKLADIDVVELNEAFAPQALAVIKELGLDPARVNPNGGAIALGHPLGATGTILTLKLALDMQRKKARYGMATMCIGGGQGITLIIERL
jgi:acetyl-CoA acetyltransferase family protein